MKPVKLGRSGLQCEAVGLGTWAMGGWMWGGGDDAAAIEAIRASLDAGVRLIDTAPAYGLGHAEKLVGQALKGRRQDAVIATKCGLVWHTSKGTHFFDEEGQPVYRYLGRDAILYEVEQSLARLQTDTIDLYITHWQDATTPVAETMQALLELKAQGTIRAIGVSNVDSATLLEYLKHGPVDAIQERYSLIDREIETTLRPICADYDIAILGYASLAMGLLAGPIDAARQFTGDDQRATNARFAPAQRGKFAAFFQEIEPLRERHGCTFAQLLVAWTVQAGTATVALCGARNAEQAVQNAGALKVTLDREDRAAIEGAAARHLSGLP
jgi:aryl-alcohol dehydrogenase-like predicted oxidoreductase